MGFFRDPKFRFSILGILKKSWVQTSKNRKIPGIGIGIRIFKPQKNAENIVKNPEWKKHEKSRGDSPENPLIPLIFSSLEILISRIRDFYPRDSEFLSSEFRIFILGIRDFLPSAYPGDLSKNSDKIPKIAKFSEFFCSRDFYVRWDILTKSQLCYQSTKRWCKNWKKLNQ